MVASSLTALGRSDWLCRAKERRKRTNATGLSAVADAYTFNRAVLRRLRERRDEKKKVTAEGIRIVSLCNSLSAREDFSLTGLLL